MGGGNSRIIRRGSQGTDMQKTIYVPIFGVASKLFFLIFRLSHALRTNFSDSGKTTIFNCLRIKKTPKGIPLEQRIKIGHAMQYQAINAAVAIMKRNKEKTEEHREKCELFLNLADKNEQDLRNILKSGEDVKEIVSMVCDFWHSMTFFREEIKNEKLWTSHFSLLHIFENIDNICKHNYEATDKDALCVRMPTYSRNHLEYIPHGSQAKFVFKDHAGQRKLRKEWMDTALQCRNSAVSIKYVIYVLALDSFTKRTNLSRGDESTDADANPMAFQDDEEDHVDQNLMSEALNMLDVVANNMFPQASVVILLNKFDIFPKALNSSSLHSVLPNYKGSSVEEGLYAIKAACKSKLKSRKDSDIEFITTNATDLRVMDKTINSIQTMLVKKILSNF